MIQIISFHNINDNLFAILFKLNTNNILFSCNYYDNNIYIIGGNIIILSNKEKIFTNNSIQFYPNTLLNSRNSHKKIIINNNIFIIGGI